MILNLSRFFISSISHACTMSIKTFVFLDSETTGLPFQENNKTKITELCLIAVQSEHINLGVFPRVQNKVNLCFSPRKFINPEATDITGLSNDLLEMQPEFDAVSFKLLQDFLNLHRKPVCLVAHNGDKFDYPILKAEIHKSGNSLTDDILCADSLLAFRELMSKRVETPQKVVKETIVEFEDEFDEILMEAVDQVEESFGISSNKMSVSDIQKMNETTPVKKQISGVKNKSYAFFHFSEGTKKRKLFQNRQPFKLTNLYYTIMGKEPVDAHRAEGDVNMIIECAAAVGQPFTDWCNSNSKKFCDIPMMVPGRSIGK